MILQTRLIKKTRQLWQKPKVAMNCWTKSIETKLMTRSANGWKRECNLTLYFTDDGVPDDYKVARSHNRFLLQLCLQVQWQGLRISRQCMGCHFSFEAMRNENQTLCYYSVWNSYGSSGWGVTLHLFVPTIGHKDLKSLVVEVLLFKLVGRWLWPPLQQRK